MIVRLTPYSEVFVNVTLSLDEVVSLSDVLGAAEKKHGQGEEVDRFMALLRRELEDALERASKLKEDRGY